MSDQIELYRRLGDYVRMHIERGLIDSNSCLSVAYSDCVRGGCDLKPPEQAKVEAQKTPANKHMAKFMPIPCCGGGQPVCSVCGNPTKAEWQE